MIFIKTMTNLPEYCYDCPCHNRESGYCQADKEHKYSIDRPFWCPLVKISDEYYGRSIRFLAIEEMKSRISELNEFSRDEIDELYMQDVLKIIDKCCGIIEKADETTDHPEWIDYQNGQWIYAKCPVCESVRDTKTPFCPICGTKMKGVIGK